MVGQGIRGVLIAQGGEGKVFMGSFFRRSAEYDEVGMVDWIQRNFSGLDTVPDWIQRNFSVRSGTSFQVGSPSPGLDTAFSMMASS